MAPGLLWVEHSSTSAVEWCFKIDWAELLLPLQETSSWTEKINKFYQVLFGLFLWTKTISFLSLQRKKDIDNCSRSSTWSELRILHGFTIEGVLGFVLAKKKRQAAVTETFCNRGSCQKGGYGIYSLITWIGQKYHLSNTEDLSSKNSCAFGIQQQTFGHKKVSETVNLLIFSRWFEVFMFRSSNFGTLYTSKVVYRCLQLFFSICETHLFRMHPTFLFLATASEEIVSRFSISAISSLGEERSKKEIFTVKTV